MAAVSLESNDVICLHKIVIIFWQGAERVPVSLRRPPEQI